jgi:hypothetical protein
VVQPHFNAQTAVTALPTSRFNVFVFFLFFFNKLNLFLYYPINCFETSL